MNSPLRSPGRIRAKPARPSSPAHSSCDIGPGSTLPAMTWSPAGAVAQTEVAGQDKVKATRAFVAAPVAARFKGSKRLPTRHPPLSCFQPWGCERSRMASPRLLVLGVIEARRRNSPCGSSASRPATEARPFLAARSLEPSARALWNRMLELAQGGAEGTRRKYRSLWANAGAVESGRATDS